MTEATRPAAPEQIHDGRAATRRAGRERRQGAGLDLILPYLLLAPSVLTVFGVLVYPLWNGLQTSTKFYRYGRAVSDIGLDNYRRLWSDPEFLDALWVTLRFVTLSVTIETVLGFALALFCAREFAGIRLLRTILIVPMVITPVVVAIVFRLIYANDAGMLTALSLVVRGRAGRDPQRPDQSLHRPYRSRCLGVDAAHFPHSSGGSAIPAAGAVRSRPS